jgi:hypothetical protein
MGITIPAIVCAISGAAILIAISFINFFFSLVQKHWVNIAWYASTIAPIVINVIINAMNVKDGYWVQKVLIYLDIGLEISPLVCLWILYCGYKRMMSEPMDSDWAGVPSPFRHSIDGRI